MLSFGSLAVLGLVVSLGGPPSDDPVLSLGDHLKTAGLVEEAITEYKRYIFFNVDKQGSRVAYAYGEIAFIYRSQGRYEEAVAMLLSAISAETLERPRDEWRIALGITAIAGRQYSLADFTLLKVEMFSPFIDARRKAAFFRGVCNLYMGKPAEARIAFRTYSSEGDPEAQVLGARIDRLFANGAGLKQKSPRVAKALSTVVPGLGELYVGDWRGGANAFAINVGAAFLVIHGVARRQFRDAIGDFIFVFGRFYGANRHRAEAAAHRFNVNAGRKLISEVLKVVDGK
jgi:hypothetical protein